MPSQIMPSLDIEKKLESIEEYEKRFLNSLENLNSSSLLKPNLKQELIKQKQGPKLDLPRPKFVSPADNRAVTSSQSRYDRIRSKSSHSRPRSRKDKNDSNLSSVESKSLNILTPVMKRSASSHSGYENSSFIFKNSLSSPMSSSHSLNSNWYKPKPLHRPNTTTSAQTKIMDSNNELDLNEKPKMAENKLDISEEYDNLCELNQSVELPDYQQKANAQSFIILNDSGASYTDQASNLQQTSEEFDEDELDDCEPRTYDHDYNCPYPNGDDEFFLVSSPFMAEESEPVLRANPLRYDTNRLSNIIEEDESHNMSLDSEHEDLKQMLELSKQVTDSYQNIHNQLNYKPVVKKRVYNLNRSYCEKSSHGEEEPDSILSYLIERLSQQHKLDLTKFEHSDHFDKMDRHLVAKTTLAEKDSEFLLTKSLYAQNKTIGENNKLITALSINEIETRRSICVDQEEKEEKNVQEEIVLIGEKSDIDSLLDNENNQLYNLLVANSSRVDQLTHLETNLNKQRLSGLRKIRPVDEHVHIEIELEPEPVKEELVKEGPVKDGPVKEEPQGKEYETELNDVAKYLVDEITKISLNKVKIDFLNEKYESKSLDMDKLIEKEMGASGGASTESKQHLVEYYRNLEQNLHQVRSEIDKLKQEAVEDLAYLSKVLNTDQMDIEDFYLNNDTDTEYLSQSTLNNGSSQVYLTPAESFSRAEENTLTSPTDAESDNEETRLTVKEMDPEEEEEETITLNNIQIEDLSHLVKNILTSRDSFKIEALEAKFEPRRQTVDKKSVENLLKMASNSASMLNLSVEAREADKPKVKPRQKKSFENQLTSLIQSSKVNSASTNFRVPSSRHFCGRLMSASQHSVSSSSSSSSSASITNTNEEISIESDSSGSASPNSNHYIHQRSMAKSVEFLGSKIEEIKKEKSLVNLMDVSGLSKSNKDLRNFVSNSYSPSQIVRPDQLELLKKPVVVSPLVLKPMKSERSDQVRVEYLQQEQIISKMEKKKFSELVKSSLSENAYKQVMESDDTLINCILEMKPLPSNSSTLKHATKVRPQPQPRSVSSQQNMYKNSSISSYSLSSNSNTNSNRNSINQDSSFRKEPYPINPLNKINPSPSPNSRPLLSASNLNKIYSNTSNQSSRSPQYNLLATRPDHSSSRTTSSDGTSATSIHQQRTRPYTPRSNISIIPDNRSGRIKKETNL